jgi:UDP-2,3-diacylglucosamine pyrophosphatase LpxH
MKLPALLCSDLHFTANPADEYRCAFWPWLAGEIEAEKAQTLLILGDVTDAKDYHSAALVNRLTKAFAELLARFPQLQIRVLAGNHDWLRQGGVFFKFLEHLDKRLVFITQPFEDLLDDGPSAYFLPYTKNPIRDWANMDFSHYDYLFMHQTAPGSIASNGQAMDGEELPPLNALKVYSGDIHVPQEIGVVEYVGSPYHVHFGDAFRGRCIVIDRKRKAYDLHFETISRLAVKVSGLRELKKRDIRSGDHVKLTVRLPASDLHDWKRIRRDCSDYLRSVGAEIHGLHLETTRERVRFVGTEGGISAPVSLAPTAVVTRFVIDEELGGDMLDVGLDIVEQAAC